MSSPDETLEYWREKGRADAETAFRAVIRCLVDGAEGNDDEPANLCAATILARVASEDLDGVADLVGSVFTAQSNAAGWRAAVDKAPSGSLDAYSDGFVRQYLASSAGFQSSEATVGDYLSIGPSTEEARWKNAMAVAWVAEVGRSRSRASQGEARSAVSLRSESLAWRGAVASWARRSYRRDPTRGSNPYSVAAIAGGIWSIPSGVKR